MDELTSIILKPFVNKLNFYIDHKEFGKAWLMTIFLSGFILVVGYVLRWFQDYNKVQNEISKIKAEAREKNFLNLEKLQIIRNKYVEDSNLFQVSLRNLIESFDTKKIKNLSN